MLRVEVAICNAGLVLADRAEGGLATPTPAGFLMSGV